MVQGCWIDFHARQDPQRLALVEPGRAGATEPRARTYAQLSDRISRIASLLLHRFHCRPGDRIGVLASNRIEQFELFFAAWHIGAVLVPLNWRLAAPELGVILADSAPKCVLVDEAYAALLQDAAVQAPWTGQTVPLDAGAAEGIDLQQLLTELPESTSPQRVEPDPDTPLMLLYTSGTTGRSKGVVLTPGTITWNAINTAAGWGLRPDDVTLVHTPLFHTGGWNVLAMPLLHLGGTVVLADCFDADEALQQVAEFGVTLLFAVPTMWQLMLECERFASAELGGLRFAITGGAACPEPLLRAWSERGVLFKQGYGLTEVGPNCFAMPAHEAMSHAGTVGFPMPHLQTRLVDPAGRDVEVGEEGELWLRGPTVCAGYWRQPDISAAALRDGGWFATGDLFRCDREGRFCFVGRSKEMFVSGGENVYPAEVELVLYDIAGVAEAAVVPVQDPRWGEVGHAFVSLRRKDDGRVGAQEAEEIRALCREQLASYKVPKQVTILDELPKSPSGKIAKRQLQQQVKEQSVGTRP